MCVERAHIKLQNGRMATRNTYFLHILVILDFIEQCHGKCSTDDKPGETCWYALWYLWFVIVLFLVGITVLIMFYCKVRAKNRVTTLGGTGRRSNPPTQPVLPPPYEAPGYPPPSYQTAIATQPLPPGYVADHATRHHQSRSMSVISNPPPYSPPHTRR